MSMAVPENALISPKLKKKHNLKLKVRLHSVAKFSLETAYSFCGEHTVLQGNLFLEEGHRIFEQLKSHQFWKLPPVLSFSHQEDKFGPEVQGSLYLRQRLPLWQSFCPALPSFSLAYVGL